MVSLDDLDIEAVADQFRETAGKFKHHVHSDAHVGRHKAGHMLAEPRDLLFLFRRESGSADDDGLSVGMRVAHAFHGGGRRRERDDAIYVADDLVQIPLEMELHVRDAE